MLKGKYPANKDSSASLLLSIYMRLANTGADLTARAKEIALYEQLLKEFEKRPQTTRTKESIRNVNLLLKYARKN